MAAEPQPACPVRIDADFPGGNIQVVSLADGSAVLRQELRDTRVWWFHWAFRVRGAAGRRWRFEFADGNVLGTRGPACSLDGGLSWGWLGAGAAEATAAGVAFEYAFPADADEVRFAFAMPYLQSNLEAFLGAHPGIGREALCASRQGREVELLHLPCLGARPKWRLLLTARHHCCESVADWVLEGIFETLLADGRTRREAEVFAVPFVDKDGVENGDQGKCRRPHDHGRDYLPERPPVYPETGTLRERIPAWCQDVPLLAVDLHCPYIRGTWNELVYMVGSADPRQAEAQARLAAILAERDRGEWDFRPTDLLAFGTSWNTAANVSDGENFARFCARQTNIPLATTFEIPYANVREATVSPTAARAFGRALGDALRIFAAALD